MEGQGSERDGRQEKGRQGMVGEGKEGKAKEGEARGGLAPQLGSLDPPVHGCINKYILISYLILLMDQRGTGITCLLLQTHC